MRTLTIRLLTPLLFLATAISWLLGGTQWSPAWLLNVGGRLSLTPSATVQLTIGLAAAAAISLFLFGSRRLFARIVARVTLLAYAFCCVATLASLVAAPAATGSGISPLAAPIAGLVLSLWFYSVINRPVSDSATTRSGSGVWFSAGVLAVWVLSVGVAVRLPVTHNATMNAARTASADTVILDYVQWQGRTLPDTGLSRLLPMLTALTLEGRSIIILYSPSCGHCREVFEEYFATQRTDAKVIAVEIPASPGTIALDGDNLGPMPCANCERLSLPAGKTYLVKPPTVVVVEDGRVVCATDSDWKACLQPPTLPAATP